MLIFWWCNWFWRRFVERFYRYIFSWFSICLLNLKRTWTFSRFVSLLWGWISISWVISISLISWISLSNLVWIRLMLFIFLPFSLLSFLIFTIWFDFFFLDNFLHSFNSFIAFSNERFFFSSSLTPNLNIQAFWNDLYCNIVRNFISSMSSINCLVVKYDRYILDLNFTNKLPLNWTLKIKLHHITNFKNFYNSIKFGFESNKTKKWAQTFKLWKMNWWDNNRVWRQRIKNLLLVHFYKNKFCFHILQLLMKL